MEISRVNRKFQKKFFYTHHLHRKFCRTTVDVCYQNLTKSLDKALYDFSVCYVKDTRRTSHSSINQPTQQTNVTATNPIFRKNEEMKKEFYDSWFALFLDVIFAVKPQPYILLCPLCKGVCAIISRIQLWFISTESLHELRSQGKCFPTKSSAASKNSSGDPFAIKNGIDLREITATDNCCGKAQGEKEIPMFAEIPPPNAMRRALTFLLIFTYQIMSVVFYLILPRSTFSSHLRAAPCFVGRCGDVDGVSIFRRSSALAWTLFRWAQQGWWNGNLKWSLNWC